MKTYRELYITALESLIEDVEKAKKNIDCPPEELEAWLWQDVDPTVEKTVPDDIGGAHILNILGQNPDLMKATVDVKSGHGTVQKLCSTCFATPFTRTLKLRPRP